MNSKRLRATFSAIRLYYYYIPNIPNMPNIPNIIDTLKMKIVFDGFGSGLLSTSRS